MEDAQASESPHPPRSRSAPSPRERGEGWGEGLALPRVPPPAPTRHRRRDTFGSLLFVVTIAAMGVAAFWPHAQAKLDMENRALERWPTTWTRAFTSSFERAFSDRFGGRDALLRLHNRTLVRAFGVSPAPNVLIAREGWLFFLGEDARALDRYHRGALPVSDADLTGVVAEFKRRERFLAARGIAYVVTIAPDKFTIYPELLPRWAAATHGATPLDRLVDAIRADGTLRFVDLRGSLRAAKPTERVYYATDSHWNSLGAAVAYRAIMQAVSDALPARHVVAAPVVPPEYVPGVDVYRGDVARMTGDPNAFGEPDYAPLWKILAAQDSRCAKRVDAGDDAGFEWYACARPGLPRAVVYRDSMAIPLIPLLSENFSRVAYVSSRRLDPAFIEREAPDIVIEEMVERAMLAPIGAPMP